MTGFRTDEFDEVARKRRSNHESDVLDYDDLAKVKAWIYLVHRIPGNRKFPKVKPEKVERATITIISKINTIQFILMEKTETFFITSQDGTTVTTKAGSLIRNILKRKGVKPQYEFFIITMHINLNLFLELNH